MSARIPISDVHPVVDCTARPAKAVAGESVEVQATVFREGHDAVNANVVLRDPRGKAGDYLPMYPLAPGTDRWGAMVTPTRPGRWTFAIEAWSDPYGTWRHDAPIKVKAGVDVELMLEEGARLMERAVEGAPDEAGVKLLRGTAADLRDERYPAQVRLAAGLAPEVIRLLEHHPVRDMVTVSKRFPLTVDRPEALFSAWYEFFPRSEGSSLEPPRSGTFAEAAKRLPAIAAMGFDVVYLPPIHPIGQAYRKGPNNTLTPGPDDPGSPWAIGGPEGGHDAIHPDLGTIRDFDRFVDAARENGLEVALDFALQASPDHPWVKEHPEWFTTRADGTIAYAENPPKKYQDIYPINFDNDFDGLYAECLRVLRHWMEHGVRIFRVDNPHTKPVMFWEQLFADIRRTDPDVLFLAEAFTRPAMMHELAKAGFHQSYTYFTWRTTKEELQEYAEELSQETGHFLRPNFFVNTPDILHAFLQYGGPPAFKIRAVLAATLSPAWGVYSGFELFESVAVRPGSEEYLNSEKYQYRPRDWEAAEAEGRSLSGYLTTLNLARRAHPALQQLRNLTFHETDGDSVLAYSKTALGPDGTSDIVLTVVNLDPHGVRETMVHLDFEALGLAAGEQCLVTDEFTGETWTWGADNYVRLDPFREPAHLLTLRRSGAAKSGIGRP
ncbi:MAG TPA: alpha-1,4-glucan--maltose-1-phosphate maltosyltransferase [Sporichthya sp.]|nr:alpha-1,4-glucan--maltose-1-phosphate maltosyltransferase [Sporichthya sp.]